MDAQGNRLTKVLLRLGFAVFGGVLLSVVIPLMLDEWAWTYLHSPLPLVALPVAMVFSYWLYAKLPRAPSSSSQKSGNAPR
jgi:hypothetical protein